MAKLQLERSTQSLLLAGSPKQNLTKLPIIIFLPLAAYFLNIALPVIFGSLLPEHRTTGYQV